MATLPCPSCGALHEYQVGASVNGAVEVHYKCGRYKRMLYFLTAKGELHFRDAIQDGDWKFSEKTLYLKPRTKRKHSPRDNKFDGISNPLISFQMANEEKGVYIPV